MTDREMLEMAAKAAGIKPFIQCRANNEVVPSWEPLTNDGDALRLAAKLRLNILFYADSVTVVAAGHGELEWYELYRSCGNPEAACRLAILRVAAEIGRSMK